MSANMDTHIERRLKELRRRLDLARKRVAYWSGRPSASGYGYSPGSGADADIEYENALADCDALADEIASITGRRPKVTDVRAKYSRAKYSERLNLGLGVLLRAVPAHRPSKPKKDNHVQASHDHPQNR